MIATLLATAGWAAPPTDEEAHAAAEALYDRELPDGAVCVGRPEGLSDRFHDGVAVGVKRGHRGCVLLGILANGRLSPPEEGAASVIRDDAWQAAAGDARLSDLLAYTQQFVLAFDTVVDSGSAGQTRGGIQVKATFLRRADGAGSTLETSGIWTFDDERQLTSEDLTPSEAYTTALSVRDDRLTGNLSADLVQQTLQQRGQSIKGCFSDAWSRELALEGRVVLTWTVADGKTDELAVVEEDGMRLDLAKCYASAVRRLEFPEGAAGTVRWVFAIQRSDADLPESQ